MLQPQLVSPILMASEQNPICRIHTVDDIRVASYSTDAYQLALSAIGSLSCDLSFAMVVASKPRIKRAHTMNASKPSAFVAYTGRDKALSTLIFNGIGKANAVDACPRRYEPWEYNDIAGTHLLSPILKGIDSSPFIVADITYLNPNVVYEIGFAIGRKKKVLLIRNSDYEGDRDLSKTVGIFDTIGYSSYRTEDDLRNKLTSHISNQALPFDITVNSKAPVYVMPNNGKSAASTHLIGRVKKARYRYRSFSATEDVRLSATDAIAQVAQSAGVISMLDGDNVEQTVRALFIAGLADGMSKPSLLLSPYMAETPLDVRDKAKPYKDPSDIADIVADFCPEINARVRIHNQ